jgi:hypothetical protein
MTITHELPARKSIGPVLVPALEPFPGLRVYEQPDELRTPGDIYVWRLGHHSGLAIAAFEYLDDADNAAWRLSELTDWSKSVEEVRAAVDGADIRDVIESTPGRFLAGHKPASAEAA